MLDRDLELVTPAFEWEPAFRAMYQERLEVGEIGAPGYHQRELPEDFGEYVKWLRSQETRDEPGKYVPQNTFWLVRDGSEIIGESRLRHKLTPSLAQFGGHIGYMIRPSARRKGYGTKILALTLDRAREMGLDRVLITCSPTNTGSARVILANGGVQDADGVDPESGEPTWRFWIDLR
jgi:predicted acetyltransferase